jgi:hypothetical protein
VTSLAVTLLPRRPKPTAALLPVVVPPDSISADRTELTLQVTVVASAAATFVPAGYGDYVDGYPSPAMGLVLGQVDEWDGARLCEVWLDNSHPVPTCADWGQVSSPFTVTVDQYDYDRTGSAPMLAGPGPARSAMLLMEQSQRVAQLDYLGRRYFAARRFVARAVDAHHPESLSVAGFAGDGSNAAAPLRLPQLPFWSPLGNSSLYSADGAVLTSAVGMLEPLSGGSAPVFNALQIAFTSTAAQAPPGTRALVALLGGGDDGSRSEAERQSALASLRQLRDETGIQTVLIVGAPEEQRPDRQALADMAAVLRAPAVSLGLASSWTAGTYAALDLASDLIDGLPLPTLSATFHVKTSEAGGFASGSILRGAVILESDQCPMGCADFLLAFSVEIP